MMNVEMIITSGIISVLISIVSAYLTMKFALYRFYREKWWDKRATAYIELIDILYDFKKDYRTIVDSVFAEGAIDAYPEISHQILDKARESNLLKSIDITHRKLDKIIGLGPLIFTENALEKLNNFNKRVEKADGEVDEESFYVYSYYKELSDGADDLYNEFKISALLELKVNHDDNNILRRAKHWMLSQYTKARDDYRDNFKQH
ncbi:hypothetical protein UDX32_05385 [Serratia marcescens]|uniref:hypothetical protein n=1 Tax=Serratia marcescens TaxID=615 RepID=UPI0011869AA4|nr:hypothetical protein [Serratia marcescens]HAT2876979.1 hypothetical protein [Serratia marcescens]HAT2887425.1 hypothetical protein [Serratia marcescens]HAT2893866.1 hypothetical protein [Serratia marcescens]HAT2899658.1 hypothetical protein [Serratia marcescens]HAT2910867.1 hypothetical protein [Serratia marcescens]